MEAINNFSGGQQSDLSKFIQAKNTYLEAVNYRPLTELGGSNGSLVNIKGNKCSVKFPTIRPTYKIAPLITNSAVTGDTTTITINGQTTASIVVNSSTTGLTIYNAIKALNNCYQTTNVTPATATFTVAYDDDHVVISQIPVYVDCTRTDSSAIVITITPSGGAVNFLRFYNFAGTAFAGQTNYVNSITNLIVIGHTFILDDIYIFVAEAGANPSNNTNTGLGYIWKLRYDETLDTTILTLIYSQWLDFNENFPIAPSAATGRYESIPIQRIYWTDFYNKIRTLNVGNPNLMAMHPKLANVISAVGFDIPIFREINSGRLECATYQLCYRLKQSLGAITNYSPLSNMVHLVAGAINDFSAGPIGYEGSIPGTNSNKAIKWDISNIDTSFDLIEYVILYRDSDSDIAQVFSILEEPVPASGTKELVVTSIDDATTIPLEEFLILSSTFTHAKTVDTKDNRLFWGNIKNKPSEINYDARAFRAKTTGTTPNFNDDDIHLKNGGIDTTYTSAQAQSQTTNPKTNDSINEYYDSTGAYGAQACYYKPSAAYVASGGTGTLRPVLGGKGANISYEFNTYSVVLDGSAGISNSDDSFNVYNAAAFRFAPSGTTSYALINGTNDSTNQVYISGTADSLKFPYKESLLRGFQHEEIYRFAIQFFDLEGNPYFSEWIGDIKFPTHGDFNKNPDATWLAAATANGIDTDYRNSFFVSNQTYGNILGIKFAVDVTSVKDIISGYRIVRVDRESSLDKTIMGCGVITPTYADGNDITNMFLPANFRTSAGVTNFPALVGPGTFGDPWRPIPSEQTWETLTFDALTGSGNADSVKTFDCFDFIVNGGLTYNSGDKLLIRSRLESRNMIDSKSGFVTNRGYRKWFDGTDWWGIGPGGTAPPTSGRFPPVSNCANGVDAWAAATGAPVSGTNYQSGLDSQEMPYYMHFYYEGKLFTTTASLTNANYTKAITEGGYILGDDTYTLSGLGYTFHNYGATFDGVTTLTNLRPCVGAKTMVLGFNGSAFRDNDPVVGPAGYGCTTTNAGKLMALYYRPNINQYGGNTYSARSANQYLACGSYIPIVRKNKVLSNNLNLTIDTFGGDVFINYWDHQKVLKDTDDGTTTQPTFRHYTHGGSIYPGNATGTTTLSEASNAVAYYLPVTNYHNMEVRTGYHFNTSLASNIDHIEDEDTYYPYHSNDNDIIKYYPKPAVFVSVNEWINRVYYSEVKFNNELQDSWQAYKTNNFYDVEGNYGGINCLIVLKEELYYIQERAFGYLLVNPITTISGDNGLPVTLGKGATIEKHRNLSLDVGTKHQWSVYKSQSNLTWIDARSKNIYIYDGNIKPNSDLLEERNFVIKRLHPNLIDLDNPVLKKGIVTTYDYYNNEFLYSFVNSAVSTGTSKEVYTLAYSEPIGKFSGLYTFVPPLYLNNHRQLFSMNPTPESPNLQIWIHNKGAYGSFYGTVYNSDVKVLCNDNPSITKVFDNLQWQTESINDVVEWIDDLTIPSANTTTANQYSDNINLLTNTITKLRCYNEYQNTDYSTLVVNTNVKKREQSWNTFVPRNKVNYDTLTSSTSTIFDPAVLTKTDLGERMRDKYMIIDLSYSNTSNRRFIIHNLITHYRISPR